MESKNFSAINNGSFMDKEKMIQLGFVRESDCIETPFGYEFKKDKIKYDRDGEAVGYGYNL